MKVYFSKAVELSEVGNLPPESDLQSFVLPFLDVLIILILHDVLNRWMNVKRVELERNS